MDADKQLESNCESNERYEASNVKCQHRQYQQDGFPRNERRWFNFITLNNNKKF